MDLQAVCRQIVAAALAALEGDPAVAELRLPEGGVMGRQLSIDASKDGLLNRCRVVVLDPALGPAGEAVRIEYEHDKQGKFEVRRVYSVQSVRQQAGRLVLLENFLATGPDTVREADFRPIEAEDYARGTVLQTLQEWLHYRAWQRQQAAR